MVENNKLQVVEEHCKKFDNQLQNHHLKWKESMEESNERWLEQGKKINQMVLQMESLSSQFQNFLANKIARKETRANSKGILTTIGTGREARMNTL